MDVKEINTDSRKTHDDNTSFNYIRNINVYK